MSKYFFVFIANCEFFKNCLIKLFKAHEKKIVADPNILLKLFLSIIYLKISFLFFD